MAALTKSRMTDGRAAKDRAFVMKAGSTAFEGGIACLENGEAVPGRIATGLVAVGRFQSNASGGETVEVERGCFKWENAGDVTASHIGSPAYIVDDQTVSASHNTNTRSQAGKIFDVDDDGVWVEI